MSGDVRLRLLLARHGETDLNRESRMQGWSDLPLNELGRRQLAALAVRLRGERIDQVWASDLRRARESAEIVAAPHGLPVRTDRRLREQNLGRWEGESWPDLPRIVTPEAVRAFLADPDWRIPEGESKNDVRERLFAFLAERLAPAAGETLLVVSHGGPTQVFVHEALSIPYSEELRFYAANGGLTEFLHVDGYWRLLTFNGRSHLPVR